MIKADASATIAHDYYGLPAYDNPCVVCDFLRGNQTDLPKSHLIHSGRWVGPPSSSDFHPFWPMLDQSQTSEGGFETMTHRGGLPVHFWESHVIVFTALIGYYVQSAIKWSRPGLTADFTPFVAVHKVLYSDCLFGQFMTPLGNQKWTKRNQTNKSN